MSFRLKTILGVALIELILMGLILGKAYIFVGEAAERELDSRVRAVSRLAAAMTINSVLSADLANLQAALDEMIAEPDIAEIAVKDDRGQILVATAPSGLPSARLRRVLRPLRVADTYVGEIDLALTTVDLERFRGTAFRQLVPIALVGMALVACFGLVVGSYVTRRLVGIERAAVLLAAGDLATRVPVIADDELSRVEASFNSMAQSLAEQRAALERVAFKDLVTSVANRAGFSQALQRACAGTRPFAVLLLDLDRFKQVNDTFGHAAGDELLRLAAARLVGSVRDGDTVARLGGDEFVLLQIGAGKLGAEALGMRVLDEFAQPFLVEGHGHHVGASVGIALAPWDGQDPERLLRYADMALYRAKSEGRGCYRFFETGMDVSLRARRRLEHDLRRACHAGELEVHYQPQVDVASSALIGVEALVRWRHPERGMIPPGEFIPIAEETGLIRPLGAWVLRQACQEAACWPQLSLAVNLSAAQFRSTDLAGMIEATLSETGFPASRLDLEITESALLQDTEATLAILRRLRTLGLRISMDDFGTGYSSLSYLQRFPFDKLKIDRSFVGALETSDGSAAIVQSVISLGHTLNMLVCAEGVETARQLAFLGAHACDQAQGYLLGHPVPASAIDERLQAAGPGPESAPTPVRRAALPINAAVA